MTDKTYGLAGKRVWVAGHRGMVGKALIRRLQTEGCTLLTVDHAALDLTRQAETEAWLAEAKPDAIFLAAAKVGGIAANMAQPADFLFDNLAIEMNIIRTAWKIGVEKLMFIGSSCIYPRAAAQPVSESALLSGFPEPTNEAFAVAKIAGIKLCEAYHQQHGANFISVIPANLFGPGDNFDPHHSHVPAALMRRFHEARIADLASTEIWGTGTPRREFLYVDDLADACVFLMHAYSGREPINIGTGADISIAEFADCMRKVTNYSGEIRYDTSKPDGMPRRLLDSSKLAALGWQPKMALEDGLRQTYAWFLNDIAHTA